MRIIDKAVVGTDLSDLARDFFDRMNPVDPNTGHFVSGTPADVLTKLAANNPIKKYQSVLDEMVGKIDRLFIAPPDELMSIHKTFVKAHGKKKTDLSGKSFKKLVKPVFGFYKEFRTSKTRALVHDWFAALGITTCPYCNREWLTQIGSQVVRDAKLLFDVDHYFPQWKYPYFALSFYNLIPTCTVCNQRLKGKKLLHLKEHFHPYVDDLDSVLRFEVPITTATQFFRDDVSVNVQLEPRSMATTGDQKRAVQTRDFFRLSELYGTHNDYAREILQKSRVYDKTMLDELYNSYGKGLFQSKEQLVRMVLGNYPRSVDMHRRPLAKLAKDLAEGSPLMNFLTA